MIRRTRTKRLGVEDLEARVLLASDICSATHSPSAQSTQFASAVIRSIGDNTPELDMNTDGIVSPIDGLLVSNAINGGSRQICQDGDGSKVEQLFFDDHANEIGPDATLVDFGGLDFGSSVEFGNLEIAGDIDVFRFVANVDASLHATLVPLGLEAPRAQLFDGDGNLMIDYQSQFPFEPLLVETLVDAGEYYFAVSSVDDTGTGVYFVDFTLADPGNGGGGGGDPTDDHVDVVGPDATVIELFGETQLFGNAFGILEESGDVDVFQFNTVEPGPFALFSHPLSLFSQRVELLDGSGSVIASAESGAFFEPLEITATLDTAGTYFLAVSAADGVSTGDYIIDVFVGEPGDPDPPTDDHVDVFGPDATTIELFGEAPQFGNAFGSLEESGDIDVFQFVAASPGPFHLLSHPISLFAPSIELLDDSGEVIASAGVNGFFEPLELVTTLDAAGTYYISVSAMVGGPFGVDTGEYLIDIFVGEPSDPDPPTDDHVNEIGPDATVVELVGDSQLFGGGDGALEVAGDVDVFQFTVDTDGPLELSTFAIGLPTRIRLLNEDGVELQAAEAPNPFDPITLVQDVDAGTYYISVAASDSMSVGVYFFNLTFGENVVVDDHVDSIGPDATVIELTEFNGVTSGTDSGFIGDSTDIDVFQFTIDETDDVRIQLLPFSLMSAQIELLDSDGVVVGSQQSSGIFVPVEIIQSLEAGTYFLSVTGGIDPAFGTTFGDYAVSVDLGSVIPPDPTDDHVDELGPDATEIDLVPQGNGQFVGSYLGNLEEAGDVDFFQFTLDTDNSNLVSSFSFDFQGLRLSLYSEDGTLLQSAETPTPFSNAQLETELLTAGTYFLSVEAVDAISTGLYVVDVLVGEFSDPDPTDDHVDEVGPDATVVELFGDSRLTGEGSGVLEAAGDIDVFQFAVESDGPVDVFSLSLGLPGSISIRLLDASGVVLQSGETQATGGVISFQEDITAGTYFISVTSLDPAVMGVPYFFTLGFGENVVVDDHVDSIGDDATEIEFIADNDRWVGFQSGVLEDSTDIDVFQFRVDAASTAHIQTFQFLLSSATITLTDSDGGVLGEAATAMFFETGTIDIDLEVGTYYLIVSSDDGSSGDYFIDVTLGERANSKNVDHQAWFSTENPIF